MRCRSLAFSLALGLLMPAPRVGAAPSPARVSLDVTRGAGTESCIDEAALERAVDERLERPAFAGDAGVDLRVHLTLERDAARTWSAAIVLLDRRGSELGRRDLKTKATDCSVLDDSIALVIALLVDSPETRERLARLAETNPPASSTPAAPAAPSMSVAPAEQLTIPPDVLAAREPYRVELGASVAALAGPLPGVAFGPELMLAVRPPHFVELRLRPSLFPARDVTAPAPGRGGRLALVQIGLDLCPLEHTLGRLRLSGCLGQSVGWSSAHGFGYLENSDASSLVYSLGLGLAARVALSGPLGFLLGLGGALPLAHNTYVSQSADGTRVEVFRAAALSATATAGLGLEL